MNKVILMGRLTRDPQVRYTQGQDSMAIARVNLHLRSIEEDENRKVSKMLTFLLALLLGKVRNLWKSMCIRERRLY